MAAMQPGNESYTRDITQAYTHSKSTFERPVYLQPPLEMGLPLDFVLLAVKSLNGVLESGLH